MIHTLLTSLAGNPFIMNIINTITAFTATSTGEAVAVGTGAFLFARFFTKTFKKVLKFCIIFIVGMLLYRHFSFVHTSVDVVCNFIDQYIPMFFTNIFGHK